ncbi:hypothetical protein ABZ372_52125 [Streptomyces sp. NPDC005921]
MRALTRRWISAAALDVFTTEAATTPSRRCCPPRQPRQKTPDHPPMSADM